MFPKIKHTMELLRNVLTVEPCDICGDVGFPELIVSCSKCNVDREHVYCMRILLKKVPDDWVCGSCQTKNGTTSSIGDRNKRYSTGFGSDASDIIHYDNWRTISPCKVRQDSGRQSSKRQRPVATGKVKFIPEDELIKLSFGNVSIVSKSVISKVALTLKSNPSIVPRVLSDSELPGNGGIHKNPVINQQASCSFSKEQKAPVTRVDKYDCREQSLDSIRTVNKATTSTTIIDKAIDKISCSSTTVGGALCAVAECNKSSVEKRELQSIQANLKLHRPFLPSSHAIWRGGFQFLQAAASGKFYDGFEAQPPCTVSSKAYKYTSRLPPVLQLESLPTSNLLTDVFQNDRPGLQDIALYFFPSDHFDRSRQNLNRVFEFMNAENTILRSFVDGVELLVFTSKHLNVDSTGTIATVNAGYFLWGVFRQEIVDKSIERLPDMEPVDMDIDMIGGVDVVGRIDNIVNDKSSSHSKISWQGTLLQSTSKKVEEETLITSSHLDFSVLDKLALSAELKNKIITELCSNPLDKLDVPPGFEAHVKNGSVKTAVNEEKPFVNGGRSVYPMQKHRF